MRNSKKNYFAEYWRCSRERGGGALDRTWVALLRTDGSLERTGGAKRQDWRCTAKEGLVMLCRGLAVH